MSQAPASDVAAIKSQRRKTRKASRDANKVLEDEALVEAGKGPRKAKEKALRSPPWHCDLPAKCTPKRAASSTDLAAQATKRKKSSDQNDSIVGRGSGSKGRSSRPKSATASKAVTSDKDLRAMRELRGKQRVGKA
ncbi:hypothetical protein NP233_g12500 [Leucocoprinus birnbaumii]|uniref:Uncharacterized protein n=1 Tax=Leucocoprinus birnbaumii TaxID=56174 RepID=A0AAD5VG80_9AGAR|nr:hypothetical protein NP233_g12500 [Leucocoprinus birnbaumii]